MIWQNFAVIILVLTGIIGYNLYHHEKARFNDCETKCYNKQKAYKDLLKTRVCLDPNTRDVIQDCQRAEQALQISINQCALNMWRRESEIARIWFELTVSYWRLLGIIIIPICIFIYTLITGWCSNRKELQIMEMHFELQKQFLDKLPPSYNNTANKALEYNFDNDNNNNNTRKRKRLKKKGKRKRIQGKGNDKNFHWGNEAIVFVNEDDN